jgi:hypothetical protein
MSKIGGLLISVRNVKLSYICIHLKDCISILCIDGISYFMYTTKLQLKQR